MTNENVVQDAVPRTKSIQETTSGDDDDDLSTRQSGQDTDAGGSVEPWSVRGSSRRNKVTFVSSLHAGPRSSPSVRVRSAVLAVEGHVRPEEYNQ